MFYLRRGTRLLSSSKRLRDIGLGISFDFLLSPGAKRLDIGFGIGLLLLSPGAKRLDIGFGSGLLGFGRLLITFVSEGSLRLPLSLSLKRFKRLF